jgi:hypothetical protein
MRVLRLVEERHHRDEDDRPIREGRTPPACLRPDDIEYKPCHFPGSRHLANPMNVSALRQSSEHWDEMVDALAFCRAGYAEIRGGYGPDIMDVWRVSQLGCSLPWYFILARGETAPGYAAALSKVALGTALLSHRLLQDALMQRWVPPPFTAATLLDLAESTGTLLSETEVCAAPAKMIVEFLEYLVSGTPRGAGGVARLIAERREVLTFGAHYANFKLLLWSHFLARRFLYADLAARGETHPDLAGLVEAPCEPPDCFLIEPPNLAQVPAQLRALWFAAIAKNIQPIAPDASDRGLCDLAIDVARIMGEGEGPAATYRALDASFGEVVRAVEVGLGGAPGEIDAATRDRLLQISPRAMFEGLVTQT